MNAVDSQLKRIRSHLPFEVDDTEAVNAAYERWCHEGRLADQQVVDLWTYCYVLRYFLIKQASGNLRSPADTDALVDKAYRKVEQKRSNVRDPARYAHWVSVVCKHTFLNYTRSDRSMQSIDADGGPVLAGDPQAARYDLGFVHEALAGAIARLPDYLETPARLYFLEEQTFEEIAEAIDKEVPTVRTYKHKAVRRLRKDERLAAYLDDADFEENR
jgi:DNA-directed RNA polymerase specialized sigma24 family protein